MKAVKAGSAVVDPLRAEGVRRVFGLPGGHVLSIYDALYDTPEITHILVRHEQAAASMAAAYAQLTGEPGVGLVTAGPGCTNLLAGVAEAHVGCLPIVIIAGRGATANAHRGAAQDDFAGMLELVEYSEAQDRFSTSIYEATLDREDTSPVRKEN